jgi:hypothetical protein
VVWRTSRDFDERVEDSIAIAKLMMRRREEQIVNLRVLPTL